ncbi:hypothetical protein V8E36_000614 [Tilletia maclaganii]
MTSHSTTDDAQLPTAAPSSAPAQTSPCSSTVQPAASTLNASEVIRSVLDDIEFQGLRGDWWAVLGLPRNERNPDCIRTAYAERRAMLGIYHTDLDVHHPPLALRIGEGIKIVQNAGRQLEQFSFYFDHFHRTGPPGWLRWRRRNICAIAIS